MRYKAWSEDRFTSGSTPTTFRFTGQRVETSFGLYFYGARWYDPALSRFAQADTMVPEPSDPQAWDRFAYSLNNPLRYIDPSGHMICDSDNHCGGSGLSDVRQNNQDKNKGKIHRKKSGIPLLDPIKGRELTQYELELLTIAIYAESQNYTWNNVYAIETIGWIFLNRVTISNYTLFNAIRGSNCGACTQLADKSNLQLNDEEQVSNYITDQLKGGLHGNAWKSAQGMAETITQKWKSYGSGSNVDPTNGSTNFYVAKPWEWDVTFAKYERLADQYPRIFRWSNSDQFTWSSIDRVLITRTNYPPGFTPVY